MNDRIDTSRWNPKSPKRVALLDLLDRLDTDLLYHFDTDEGRRALNAPEPPVTYDQLTQALCLGDAASEHPAADVLDVWMGFHRDVAMTLGACIGAAMSTGGRLPQLGDYERVWTDAAEYHRDVLARRRSHTARAAGADPAECDGWCIAQHGSQAAAERAMNGFHHRGASTVVDTADGPGREIGQVKLALGRYTPGRDNPEKYPVVVEVDWPENAGMENLTELTLDEADRVGRALLMKVYDARMSSGSPVGEPDASAPAEDGAEEPFVMPRKVEQGVEHPQWCEVRRFCTVEAMPESLGASGWHRDEPERYQGEDDNRLAYDVSAGAFHDTDGAIDRPTVAIRVVETDLVDSFVEGSLTPDEARALAALLVEAADHAATLAEHYA